MEEPHLLVSLLEVIDQHKLHRDKVNFFFSLHLQRVIETSLAPEL